MWGMFKVQSNWVIQISHPASICLLETLWIYILEGNILSNTWILLWSIYCAKIITALKVWVHVWVFRVLPWWLARQANCGWGICHFTYLWCCHRRQITGFTVRGAAFSVWIWLWAALWVTGAARSPTGLHCRWGLRVGQGWAERKMTSFIAFLSLKTPERVQLSVRTYDLWDTGKVEH